MTTLLSPQALARIDHEIAKYPADQKQSAVMAALAIAQDEKGWLAGLRDRFVGRALSLLHARPAHPWTVEALGREVGLSRSALAQRFTGLLGQPPMQYLARWRLQLAARQLRGGDVPLAVVAEDVGYESEAAFNRAFKREFGVPPATWRRAGAEVPANGAAAPA